MTSMDPTTTDTIDADIANEMAGESDAADPETSDTETGSMSVDTAALGGGAIADETGRTGDDFQVGD